MQAPWTTNAAIVQTFVELLFWTAFGSHRIVDSELQKFYMLSIKRIVLNCQKLTQSPKSKVDSGKVKELSFLLWIKNGSEGEFQECVVQFIPAIR